MTSPSKAGPIVVVADKVDAKAIELLSREATVVDVSAKPGELAASLAHAAGLMVRGRTKVDQKLLEKAPKLQVVGRAGVGVDNIDVLAAHHHSVVVVNAPSAASVSVAELTIGLMVAAARNLGSHLPALKSGQWTKGVNGFELAGRKVGFIGYGRIAQEVAARAKAFKMTTQAYDPYVTVTKDGTPLVPLEVLLATSDIVSLHANLTESDRHILGPEAFQQLKKGAMIVNVARGPLIDEAALLAALEAGTVSAAALDVFEEEPPKNVKLLSHPKVVVTPHIGASTEEAQEKAGLLVAEDILRVLRGEHPDFPVHL